jgi:ABC-2 type transport system permease protein
MSLKILTSNLKLGRWGILAWSGIVFLYALFVVYLYPIVSESSTEIMGYINSLPDSFKAAFGLEGTLTEMLSLEAFAAVEFFSFWPLLIGIYGIFVCVGIAREMEQGTLDLLIAQPVRRYKVIAGKFAVFIVSALLIAVFSILGIMAGAATVDTPVNIGSISLVFVEAFLLVLALGSVTLLCAAIFLRPRQALMVSGMFMGLSYILNFVVPALPEAFEWLRNLSVFYHFHPTDITTNVALNGISVAIYVGVFIICTSAALIIFQRRDLVA